MRYRAYRILNGSQESESIIFDSKEKMVEYFDGVSTAAWDYEKVEEKNGFEKFKIERIPYTFKFSPSRGEKLYQDIPHMGEWWPVVPNSTFEGAGGSILFSRCRHAVVVDSDGQWIYIATGLCNFISVA